MKKLFSLISTLFFSISSFMKDSIYMNAVEAAAKGSLSNFGGESPDEMDYDGYMGIEDMSLEDPESGFLGHAETQTTNVLSFAFRNETSGNKEFLINPGFKNFSLDGTPINGVMNDAAGGFISLGGSATSKIKGLKDANCTLEDFIKWVAVNPTAFSGFRVKATSLATEAGVLQSGQAEAQIQQMAITFVKQSITGDAAPFTIRPGLNVDGHQQNATIAVANAPFTLDFRTSAKINLLEYTQISIDLYLNNSLSKSHLMDRKHALARKNIRDRY